MDALFQLFIGKRNQDDICPHRSATGVGGLAGPPVSEYVSSATNQFGNRVVVWEEGGSITPPF
jgi:hypothetical protein